MLYIVSIKNIQTKCHLEHRTFPGSCSVTLFYASWCPFSAQANCQSTQTYINIVLELWLSVSFNSITMLDWNNLCVLLLSGKFDLKVYYILFILCSCLWEIKTNFAYKGNHLFLHLNFTMIFWSNQSLMEMLAKCNNSRTYLDMDGTLNFHCLTIKKWPCLSNSGSYFLP